MNVVAIALLMVLAACAPRTDEGLPALETEVAEIRAAAVNRDRAGAERELAGLRSSVQNLRRSGDITQNKADEILSAADEVERDLRLLTSPRPPTLQRSPTPSPAPRRTSPPPTPEPTPEETETAPTQQPEPTQAPQTPDDNEGEGDGGQDGLPGILRPG